MKIGYITAADSKSKYPWSGTIYYVAKALEKHCGEVVHLGPVPDNAMFRGRITNKLLRTIGLGYDPLHDYPLARKYARHFSAKIAEEKLDVLVACAASTEIALLETEIPIIGIADVTGRLAHEYYEQFSNIINAKSLLEIDGKFIHKCSAVIYSSDWAANSARQDYGNVRGLIETIPFGANVDPEDIPSIETITNKPLTDVCRLLFLGVDWVRKGGDIAFDTMVELNKRGISTTLTVCGCIPPKKYSHPNLTVIPFLNKNIPAERQTFNEMLLNVDFLLVPTRKEAYGIVFCEANAFGLPAITTATGGVTQIVRNDINGFALPEDAESKDYANTIARYWSDRSTYSKLVLSSRNEYDTRLNWDTWGEKATKVIHKIIRQPS
ncbi:MAG: glycosyltransferase family 4 protein [Ignavibacteria bacterium]|nr:glycosyltransferase family 4 protein [Ignavibacteria bacterium]